MTRPSSDDTTLATREHLTLKWGVPKDWRLRRDETRALFQRYADLGWSWSAMAQPNTDAHKSVLCELIDALDADTIGNDWTGEDMTKEQAKEYVMTYGRKVGVTP